MASERPIRDETFPVDAQSRHHEPIPILYASRPGQRQIGQSGGGFVLSPPRDEKNSSSLAGEPYGIDPRRKYRADARG